MDDWTGRGDLIESSAFAGDDFPCPVSFAPAPAIDRESDDYLMSAVGRGDARAYARLVDRHLPSVYRLCHRLTGNRQEAEDVAQESFARLWQSAPNWRSHGGGVPAWLHRVARNLCLDRLRAPRAIATDNWPEIADRSPDAVRQIETGQLRDIVEACLHRLSPAHRSALVLSYYEGHSNAISAQIMDMNIKAFESLLLRARRRMAAELVQAGVQRADMELLA